VEALGIEAAAANRSHGYGSAGQRWFSEFAVDSVGVTPVQARTSMSDLTPPARFRRYDSGRRGLNSRPLPWQ
jgi:hypothetical protein